MNDAAQALFPGIQAIVRAISKSDTSIALSLQETQQDPFRDCGPMTLLLS
jgi:hypothetical protein